MRPSHVRPQAAAGHRYLSALRPESNPQNARSRCSPVLGHRQCTRPFSVYTMQSARSGYSARVMGRVGSWPGIAFSSRHNSRGSMRGRTPWHCHSFAFSAPQSNPRSALKSRHRPAQSPNSSSTISSSTLTSARDALVTRYDTGTS